MKAVNLVLSLNSIEFASSELIIPNKLVHKVEAQQNVITLGDQFAHLFEETN
jgi:hypothetical protein